MAHINLLPWRENLRKQRQRDFYKHLGAGFTIALGLVILGHLSVQGEITYQEERNAFLQQTIEDLDKQVVEIKRLKEARANLVARMEVIQKLQDTRSYVVHLYDELARTLPDGIVLTNVNLKGEQTLEINGVSDSAARVADYLRNLNKSDWLANASIVGSGILAQGEKDKAGAGKKHAFRGEYAFFITAQFAPPKPGEGHEVAREVK
ncbi:MAG: PilN domain-containing protein [Halothiobacillaceae bacterium]|nr:MAG: PilN domain-containing protein [Halothiobacillaceae bacterium]